tara:strand:- start:464 stop:754 length:291 start_codon:yes stop_codon:yes gene_type:complete
MRSFFLGNATPDFLFIRPIVNPIDAESYQKMLPSVDLVLESGDINKSQKSELLVSDTAMCVFTLSSIFNYQGSQNDYLPHSNFEYFLRNDKKWKVE